MGKEQYVSSSEDDSKWKKEFKKWGWRIGLVGIAFAALAWAL